MVDYEYGNLFLKPHIDKQLKIATEDGLFSATNKDIDWENFELTESLCSESELRFGSCEASMAKFRIHNTFSPLKDKWITVTETLEGNTDSPFQFGIYKVFSDVPTADRLYRDVIAYDAMYDIINSSAIKWYNTILPNNDSEVTMKQFRTSFANYFGLEQEEITLANDDMIVGKTIQVGEGTEIENEEEQTSILKESLLSGLDVIRAICEINGCFGHIGRNGKFHYIYLDQDMMGLYPRNTLFPDNAPYYLPQAETGHLYPQSPKSTRIGNGTYINANYEDFLCKKISKIQIREKEDDAGVEYPEGESEEENRYIIEDNFLVYGKSKEELSKIAKNIFEKIKDIIYRPFSSECIGNPCLEVGDPLRLSTRYELIESYILKRTLKGIQGLRDSISASGAEKYTEKINSVRKSIMQLKGRTNTLIRNVDETRSELTNFEKDVSDNYSTTKEMSSVIQQTAENITTSVSETYETKTDAGETKRELSSRIEQTATSIEMGVTNGEKTAGIKVSLKNENGEEIASDDGNIEMTGIVTFKNLTGEEGETRINGALLETGTVSCDTLNGGVIRGQVVEGGEINGSIINCNDVFTVESDGKVKLYGNVSLEIRTPSAYENYTSFSPSSIVNTGHTVGEYNSGEIYNPFRLYEEVYLSTVSGSRFSRGVFRLGGQRESDGSVLETVIRPYDAEFGGSISAASSISAVVSVSSKFFIEDGEYLNSKYQPKGNYLTTSGGTMTGNISFNNNKGIRATDKSGTTGSLIYLNTSNNINIGDTSSSMFSNYVVVNVVSESTGGPFRYFFSDFFFAPSTENTGDPDLGTSSRKWGTVFAKTGSINTSDRKQKHNIEDIPDKYMELFYKLKPKMFMFNDGDRIHIGGISQDVEEAMEEIGITPEEFGGFCKDIHYEYTEFDEDGIGLESSKVPATDENGEIIYDYSMRYQEFIFLNIEATQRQKKEIKKLEKKILEQKSEINSLKESVSFLMQTLI